MKTFAKIYGEVVYLMTLAIIVIGAVFAVPRLFGIAPYIVQSGSMEPLIGTGSVAFINHKDTDVAVGDIVTYEIGNGETDILVTHRVVKKNSDGTYTMKGDANDSIDIVTISPEQVVGTYVTSIPKIGYVVAGLNRPKLYVIAGFVVLLNVSSRIIDALMEDEDEDEEEEKPKPRKKKKRAKALT